MLCYTAANCIRKPYLKLLAAIDDYCDINAAGTDGAHVQEGEVDTGTRCEVEAKSSLELAHGGGSADMIVEVVVEQDSRLERFEELRGVGCG